MEWCKESNAVSWTDVMEHLMQNQEDDATHDIQATAVASQANPTRLGCDFPVLVGVGNTWLFSSLSGGVNPRNAIDPLGSPLDAPPGLSPIFGENFGNNFDDNFGEDDDNYGNDNSGNDNDTFGDDCAMCSDPVFDYNTEEEVLLEEGYYKCPAKPAGYQCSF
jgi:hypothetical protein